MEIFSPKKAGANTITMISIDLWIIDFHFDFFFSLIESCIEIEGNKKKLS